MRPILAASLAAVLLSACASSRGATPTDERYRDGSLYHAYGAPLVLFGASSALASASLFGVAANLDEESPARNSVAITAGVIGAVAAVEVIVGVLLVNAGDREFYGPTTERKARARARDPEQRRVMMVPRSPPPSEHDVEETETSTTGEGQ